MPHPHTFLPGASKRLEVLSDGVFAIACTLLVLEIKIPHFEKDLPITEQWEKFAEIFPTIFAFIFSFLNILVFWINHDALSQVIVRFDTKVTYLNIIFLMLISLIPFTTAFIGGNPTSFIAIAAYGAVLLLASIVAVAMYHHLAFKAKLLMPEVTLASKKRVYRQIFPSPFIYLLAIGSVFFTNIIPIIIYSGMPVIYMFMPQLEFEMKESKSKE